MKTKNEKKVRFSISMPKDLSEMVDEEAKRNRWSRVNMINFIIESYLEVSKRNKYENSNSCKK